MEMLEMIDEHLASLKQARALLNAEPPTEVQEHRRPGRPVGSVNRTKKRNLSPEGRERIRAAVRRRWATQKRALRQ